MSSMVAVSGVNLVMPEYPPILQAELRSVSCTTVWYHHRMQGGPDNVTQLLGLWSRGDQEALNALMPIVYGELHKIAGSYLRRERSGHTLQPTALVHEAWLQLVRQDQTSFENRKHFYALAAQIMRRILVDHARASQAQKRGGGGLKLELNGTFDQSAQRMENFLFLDEALTRLASASPRQAQVIELRYFGGLSGEDIADLLGVSPATISRDQHTAEAWLSHMMADGQGG